MPKLDGTGPLGEGPKTGRGLGKCLPKDNNQTTQINNDQNKISRPKLGIGRVFNRENRKTIGRVARRGNR